MISCPTCKGRGGRSIFHGEGEMASCSFEPCAACDGKGVVGLASVGDLRLGNPEPLLIRDAMPSADIPMMRAEPIPMLLWCPQCGERHVDRGEFATKIHHTHACQDCGMTWRPAVVATTGVLFLPGFKDADA